MIFLVIFVLLVVILMNFIGNENSEPNDPIAPKNIIDNDTKVYNREALFESMITNAKRRFLKLGLEHPIHYGTYKSYLQSDHWTKLSKHAQNLMNNKCEFCDGSADQVHHVYYPLNQDDDGLENIAFLCVTCSKCHDVLHGKKKTSLNCVLCGTNACTDWLPIKTVKFEFSSQPTCKRCKSIATGFRDEAYGWDLKKYISWVEKSNNIFLK